ncbi:MAG: hypothetical protein RIQ60_2472 [Pseudomonadota bacterium]|jgi:glyoxylase-like metal-dependent hydrolase (beta-lactamase superfamily II)
MRGSPDSSDLVLLERGWLSSNNVLLRSTDRARAGAGDEAGAAWALLFDSGHVRHVEQTLALVRQALGGLPLRRLVNTHLHSDHCGGNARLQREHSLQVLVPPGHAEAVRNWDVDLLGYRPTGQICPRFVADAVVQPGEVLSCGRWRFEALAAPGHDPHALIYFDAGTGVLLSGDALWRDGFGVVFPELDGERGFADVAETLDLIERLPVSEVLPGHGGRFSDVAGALARARSRLAQHERNPQFHARHAAKVLLKYHMMEVGCQELAALQAWLAVTPLLGSCQQRSGAAGSTLDFGLVLLDELCRRGVLAVSDGMVHDV